MKMIQLTLHNNEDILINWDNVAFATPSTSEETREVYTKIVFTGGERENATEVDVTETVKEISKLILGGPVDTTTKKTAARRK